MNEILDANVHVLPAMMLRGNVCLPDNETKVEVAREVSVKALTKAMKNDNYIILLIQKDITKEEPIASDVYEMGVLGKIKVKVKLPNGNYRVKVDGLVRVKINELVLADGSWEADFSVAKAFTSNLDEEIATVRLLVNDISTKASSYFEKDVNSLEEIKKGVSSEKLANLVAYRLSIIEDEKVKYLLELDTLVRLKYILSDINKEEYYQSLERKINESVQESVDENQKEFYLRERMKAIQNQLGDKAKKESEIDELREMILAKKMPKSFEEKMLDELKHYELTPQASPDSANLRQYIEFVLALPFNEETTDKNDLKLAKATLDKGHYGLEKVKDRIIEYLAVKMATNKNPQTILCLVGPPGVGKTSLARGIADSLGRKFVRIALGGVKDEAEIRGHRRTYLGALPGRIMTQMKKAEVNNPLFLIDEIDKLGADYKGDPSSAMLEVLDPEQNHVFIDHYVEEPYDLSNVLFIATANYLGDIPEALRDRMEIIQLSSYTEIEKLAIAKEHLIQKEMDIHGLTKTQFKINDAALKEIINGYTREAGVRQLERVIGSLCRKSVRKIYQGDAKKINVTKKNLESYLGRSIFSYSDIDKMDEVGVINGLAYTAFGGDTLQIEATYYKGKGGLILTGNLGDIMKESAKTALSLVKSRAKELNIDESIFMNNDIHVHVPEGAVPKDGPSAGVTMTTAFVSALTGRKVRHDLGMTGEITLRGKVLPIGGLREKSIAAHRNGLKTILIPYENIRDIEDIPDIVKNELEIIPVKTIDDVLKKALL